MNNIRQIIALFFGVMTMHATTAVSEENTRFASDKRTAREVWDRVINYQEIEALREATTLDASVVVPMLSNFAEEKTTNPARAAIALETLKKVKDYAGYFRNKLVEAASKGSVDEDTFVILAMIGTEEAAAVAAPYLFDFTEQQNSSDVRSSLTAGSAVDALIKMKIADRPTGGTEKLETLDELVEWQKWAISHAYVPKDWSARVGFPENLRKVNEIMHAQVSRRALANANAAGHASSGKSGTYHFRALPSHTAS